jgi:hypothetical protein
MTNIGPEPSGLTEASDTEAKTAAATEDVRRVGRPTEQTSAYGGEGEYSILRVGGHVGDPRHRGYELMPGPIFQEPIPREQTSAYGDVGEYSILRVGGHVGDPRHRGYELMPGPIFQEPIPRKQASAFGGERGLRYAGDRRSHSLGIGRVEENRLDNGPQRSSSWRLDARRV